MYPRSPCARAPAITGGDVESPTAADGDASSLDSVVNQLSLLDLDDDCLRLVAGRCFKGGWGGGLLGACSRTRRAVMESIESLSLDWCVDCGTLAFSEALMGFNGPLQDADNFDFGTFSDDSDDEESNTEDVPPCPPECYGTFTHDQWLAAVLATLRRTTGLRTVDLTAFSPETGPPACPVAADRQAAGWRAIGAALRGAHLTELRVAGEVVGALLARAADDGGGGGGGPPPLRALRMRFVARDAAVPGRLPAAVATVASGLEVLDLHVDGWPSGTLADCFQTVVGGFPRLRRLHISGNVGRGAFERAAAAAVAATCPALEELALAGGLGPGAGTVLASARGALPHLTTVDVSHLSDPEPAPVAELAALLRGRCLQRLTLAAEQWEAGVVAAVAGSGRLPATLELTESGWSGADCLSLLRDERAAHVARLSLPATEFREEILSRLPPLPRLVSLSIVVMLENEVDRSVFPSSWAVPPALADVTVDLVEAKLTPAILPAPRTPATVRWLLRRLASSQAAATTLASVTVNGLGAVDRPLVDAVAMLAPAPALRSVRFGSVWKLPRASAVAAIARLHAALPRVVTAVEYKKDMDIDSYD